MDKRFLLIPLACGLVIVGCTGVTDPAEFSADFWPMAVGYTWTYRDGFDDLTGVTITEEDGGWYCWDEGVARLALRCTDRSCRRQPTWPPSHDPRYTVVLLKPPLEEGATWPLYGDGTGEATLVQADFTYETPDGDWQHCYRVELAFTWEVYARGIGLVAEGIGEIETRHLVEYDFGG